MTTEILVHIKAPGRVVDDKRYVSIAQGVLNFESSVTTKVTESTDSTRRSESSSVSMTETQPHTDKSFSISNSLQKRSGLHSKHGAVVLSGVTPRQHIQVRDAFGISKASSSLQAQSYRKAAGDIKRVSPARAELSNISCSTPAGTREFPVTSTVRVLVPDTDNATRKRRWSETLGTDQELTIVSDSQSVWSACSEPSQHDVVRSERKRQFHSILTTAMIKSKILEDTDARSTVTLGRNELVQAQAFPLADNAHTTHSLVPPVQGDSTSNELTSECNVCNEIAVERTSVACNTSKGQHQTSSSDHCCVCARSTGSCIETTCPPIITFKPLVRADSVNDRSSTQIGPLSASGKSPDAITNAEEMSTILLSDDSFSSIQSLPLVINAPISSEGRSSSWASEHPILKATAKALSLPEGFRPCSMTRAVLGKERGYWKVPINIVTSEKAIQTRTQIAEQSRNAMDTSWQPLLKHPSLTEAEFLEVWAELDKFVSSGNAGHNIRVIRRSLTVLLGKDPIDHSAQFHLQVFCYGKAIPYLYAMLLVCTRMYVLRVPPQWISTTDESTIITMAGHDAREEDLEGWAGYSDKYGAQYWKCGKP